MIILSMLAYLPPQTNFQLTAAKARSAPPELSTFIICGGGALSAVRFDFAARRAFAC